ncbi:MAG: InlB B-repeat-containing protein [Microbacterium sp.]
MTLKGRRLRIAAILGLAPGLVLVGFGLPAAAQAATGTELATSCGTLTLVDDTYYLATDYGTSAAPCGPLTISGDVTLDLNGHSAWFAGVAGGTVSGITVPVGASLTIEDTAGGGALTAVGAATGAGISVPTGATLSIESGTVTATGGAGGAGIGAIGGADFQGGDAGAITINGGTVTAQGTSGGAGIGGGYGNGASLPDVGPGGIGGAGGVVTINGGSVTAKGAGGGAGIGGGYGGAHYYSVGGAGGTLVVNGGTVSATGGSGAAGIGGGFGFSGNGSTGGAGATVTINDGAVTALGGVGSAGIGGGYGGASLGSSGVGGAGGTVVIAGGTVTATGRSNAPGIGGGNAQGGNRQGGAAGTLQLQAAAYGTVPADGGSGGASPLGQAAVIVPADLPTDSWYEATASASSFTVGFGHVLSFDAQGHGTAPDAVYLPAGTVSQDPGALTADGYIFGGWVTSADAPFPFGTTLSADATAYASWIAIVGPTAGDASAQTTAGVSVTLEPIVTAGTGAVVSAVFDNAQAAKTVDGEGEWSISVADSVVTVVFTPADGFTGTATTQTYTVADSQGLTASGELHVVVNAVATPTTPATESETGVLATTGGSLPVWPAVTGMLLIVVGAAAIGFGRARRARFEMVRR